jgi:hypothetical protein
MTDKLEACHIKIVKLPRMLKSDVRPMERCCGHHLLAHDARGCLITGCGCRGRTSRDRPDALVRSGRVVTAEDYF